MKIILTSVALLLFGSYLQAQDSSVVALKFESSLSSHPDRIVVAGVHELATECIDGELAEVELPPFAPSTLSARMRLPVECNEFTDITSSYRDLREMQNADQYMIKYKIDVSRASGFTITVSWDLHWAIERAIIYNPNNREESEVDMREEPSMLIESPFVRELDLEVYFNFTETSVGDSQAAQDAGLFFPNPATEVFRFAQDLPFGSHITIHDVLGNQLVQHVSQDVRPELNVAGLSAGMYIVKVRQPNGILRSQSLLVR